MASNVLAQSNAGGTTIQNKATATYSDGSNSYSADSNTVTVTVANVSSITITPDAGTVASVVPGQTGVKFSFRVTNTGNFSDQVRFLANGASIQLTGAGTVTAAVIDVNGNGNVDGGDTNIFTNGSDVVSASIAQDGYIDVIVVVSVNAGASAGATINVQLGDASTGSPTYDNQTPDNLATPSAHEVRTVSTSSVNGVREARGDATATVGNDAQLRLTLTAPAGPVALGGDITYAWEVCNTGANTANAITLTNGPAGSNSAVFIIAPIPVGTTLKSGQSFPAGTLYSTTALTTSPLTATWTASAPSDLSTVTRIAFNVGNSLAASACSASISMIVTVNTNVNASNPINEIGDAFATNSISSTITDQSGDTVVNAGDSNSNFDEGNQPGNLDGNGVQQQTALVSVGGVLNGPSGAPGATGPTSNNDDYTNKGLNTGLSGVAPGGNTTAGGTITFTNTVQNTGNANDTFTLTAPTVPSGFTVEISTDGGTNWTTVSGGGSTTIAVNFGSTANYQVRITAPSGKPITTGYDTVIRATSANSPSSSNDTIDRVYTGFISLSKTSTIINSTGTGGATDPVPGALVEYTITYTNITSTGGSGSVGLTATNIVITEDGNTSPNNWGTTTTHVVGSAIDSNSGTITGDTAASTSLTDTVPTLVPGASGTFKF
ncbi:MAG TPA: hypothetical protein VEF04_21950, partial [Blastocatellia bacterium]|nr:hypothetical protein [Blastocatellia bacterium]